MKIGQMIKIERQKQSIKQDELANGICSPSYLSKIEGGSAIPSEEIQHLLLQRLHIPLDKIQQQLSPDILIQFKKQFGQIIDSRERHATDVLFQEIRSFLKENKNHPNIISLLIIETRLMLTTPSNPTENLTVLNSLQNELSPSQHFHLLLIQGIIAYNDHLFSDAQTIFANAYSLAKRHRMEDWEMAELHYMLSLAAIAEYQHIVAMEHIEKALAYFNQKLLTTRSIDCLLILGNAQKHTKNIQGALVSFESAKDITIRNGFPHRIGMIEHNLGACYSLLQNHELALHHFTQGLLSKVRADDQVITVFALIKEHKKMRNLKQAKNYLEKGIALLHSLSESNQKLFGHHFSIYQALLYSQNDFINTFEAALDYFQQKKSYYYCFIYCHVLADVLIEKNQYKLATTYSKQAFHYHLKQKCVDHWEALT